MSKSIALLFCIVAPATAIAFLVHPIRLPELVSAEGSEVDTQLNFTLIVAGVALVLAHVLRGLFVCRFGKTRLGPALNRHGSPKFEIVWMAVTAVVPAVEQDPSPGTALHKAILQMTIPAPGVFAGVFPPAIRSSPDPRREENERKGISD